eukprot:989072-Amorphochlora_amoeboformis.AAC.1
MTTSNRRIIRRKKDHMELPLEDVQNMRKNLKKMIDNLEGVSAKTNPAQDAKVEVKAKQEESKCKAKTAGPLPQPDLGPLRSALLGAVFQETFLLRLLPSLPPVTAERAVQLTKFISTSPVFDDILSKQQRELLSAFSWGTAATKHLHLKPESSESLVSSLRFAARVAGAALASDDLDALAFFRTAVFDYSKVVTAINATLKGFEQEREDRISLQAKIQAHQAQVNQARNAQIRVAPGKISIHFAKGMPGFEGGIPIVTGTAKGSQARSFDVKPGWVVESVGGAPVKCAMDISAELKKCTGKEE